MKASQLRRWNSQERQSGLLINLRRRHRGRRSRTGSRPGMVNLGPYKRFSPTNWNILNRSAADFQRWGELSMSRRTCRCAPPLRRTGWKFQNTHSPMVPAFLGQPVGRATGVAETLPSLVTCHALRSFAQPKYCHDRVRYHRRPRGSDERQKYC